MIKRPRLKTPLYSMLPWGYQKRVCEIIGLSVNGKNQVMISQVLTRRRKHSKVGEEIMEAIEWVALGNLMEKLFKL